MFTKQYNQVSSDLRYRFDPSSTSIFIIIVLSLLSCDLTSCSRNSNFYSVPTTVKAYENDTVVLPCEYNLTPHYVRWFLEDTLIADTRDKAVSDKYVIWQNGSLQVNDVKASDSGDYVCEVMTNVVDSQIHSIEVQYPPSVISSMNGMVEVKIGSIFDIVCEARGVPSPMIYWRRGEGRNVTEIFKHTPRYMMEVNNINLSGPLECVASNGVGEPAVAGIFLIVLFEPSVLAVTRFVHSRVGMRANLECEVTSSPSAKVYWFHRNAPVNIDSKTSKTSLDLNPNKTAAYYHSHKKHTLTIKSVHEIDLGMYECKAENEVGLKSAHIELAGRPMPSIFKQSPVASLPTTHNLIWTTESFSPIIEYSLKFRQIPSGNILPENRGYDPKWKDLTIPGETTSDGPLHSIGYTLRGLMAGTVYEAAVASRNRFGWSDISKIIKFHTGAEGQSSTYPSEISQYSDVETNYFDSPPQESLYDDDNSSTRSSINHLTLLSLTIISMLMTRFYVILVQRN